MVISISTRVLRACCECACALRQRFDRSGAIHGVAFTSRSILWSRRMCA